MEEFELSILEAKFMQGFIQLAAKGYEKGWHELNGGNLSYRMKNEDIEGVKKYLKFNQQWLDIGAKVPKLAKEFFLVTGSGKFFGNVEHHPEANLAIIQLDEKGEKYKIVWGLHKGDFPTSELPSHLMNHEVKITTSEIHRVIYHAHPANLIALTFVLPLKDEIFTRELWEMMTECPIVFSEGIGVVPWMVPGSKEIAVATSQLMKKYNIVVWVHHGLFCSGVDFDQTFGLMHTVEKSAEILVKVLSMGGKRQTITVQNFRDLAEEFNVTLDEKVLFE